ncbi:hypothetical protein [Actinomadura sp. NEAU-AAG7]|uniref:hypothetical protein n=1 Tax=Actinomadura sp. NEAU-AAG7 TaxID=2839640 RepID=UPI001BE4D3A1|nr:hypothetical protein [Actinomadura sp. NEAU-AAG7]MBT2213224.1 hypothetical protein [Actinomadura sp. NEAU-AAG7]
MGEYTEVPADLPALRAALGAADHAEALARSLPEYQRVQAMTALAAPLAAAGEPDRAEELLRSARIRPAQMREPYDAAWAWTDLAWLAVLSGDADRADRSIRSAYAQSRVIDSPYLQGLLLLAWARVLTFRGDRPGAGGMVERALTRAAAIGRPSSDAWAMKALPLLVSGGADPARGEALARSVPQPYHRSRAVAGLAVSTAAAGEPDRAAALRHAVSDADRLARLDVALGEIAAVRPRSDRADPFRRARAATMLAEAVMAGGAGHAWGAYEWAEPLARYPADPGDQKRIFAVLAAAAVGRATADQTAALADRADAILDAVTDQDYHPQALIALAWMMAHAGDRARATVLGEAAEALVRYGGHHSARPRIADLAARTRAAEHGTSGLPALIGTPKQQAWARNLRAAYVKRRWGADTPPESLAALASLTDARWWIENRDRLDEALGPGAGLWNDEALPRIIGSPKQEQWARKLRANAIAELWPDGPPTRLITALTGLTEARWWIDHRDDLRKELTEFATTVRFTELPRLTGTPQSRRRANKIRTELVRRRWRDDKIPPVVLETLTQLTNAEWWLANVDPDEYLGADYALESELPESARKLLTLPTRHLKRKHPEPCSDLPDYATAWQATFNLAAQFGDLRACREGSLTPFVRTCCGQQAVRDAEKAGKQAWLETRAKKIRKSSLLMTASRAMEEARSDLRRIERNLDGWG